MSPLGKFTLALLGFKAFGAVGLLWGLFFGHIFIDRTKLISVIEKQLSNIDDNIRLMLPYNLYRFYNRLDGNFWGKIWGSILGSVLFGLDGFIVFFVVGHYLFDTPDSRHAKAFRAHLDSFFNLNLGKIAGWTLGFSLHSVILMFSGFILGWLVDYYRSEKKIHPQFSLSKVLWLKNNPFKLIIDSLQARHNSLLQAMAGLSAKVAKVDGNVSECEIHIFKQIFDIPANENRKISAIFNKAKTAVKGYEAYARQIRHLTKDNLEMKENVIENLFKIALADGAYSEKELNLLKKIAEIIELPEGNFDVIRQSFESKTRTSSNIKDFYEVLGIFCNASDTEIKCRWKELINIYHPDRIQANGANADELEKSTIKMAEINNAYQSIMKSRKAA